MIPVGTQVRMSVMGKACFPDYETEPHKLAGVIIEGERKSKSRFYLDCVVRWSNDCINTYDYEHLEPVMNFSDKKLEDYL